MPINLFDNITAVMLIVIAIARLVDFVLMPEGQKKIRDLAGDAWVAVEDGRLRPLFICDGQFMVRLYEMTEDVFPLQLIAAFWTVISTSVIAVGFQLLYKLDMSVLKVVAIILCFCVFIPPILMLFLYWVIYKSPPAKFVIDRYDRHKLDSLFVLPLFLILAGGCVFYLGVFLALVAVVLSMYFFGLSISIFFLILLFLFFVIDLHSLRLGKKCFVGLSESSSRKGAAKESLVAFLFFVGICLSGCALIFLICSLSISPLSGLSVMARVSFSLINTSTALLPIVFFCAFMLVLPPLVLVEKVLKVSFGRAFMAYYADSRMNLTRATIIAAAIIKSFQVLVSLIYH